MAHTVARPDQQPSCGMGTGACGWTAMRHERLEMKLAWGARREDVNPCARRIRDSLVGFGKIHPALSKWYEDNASESGRRINIASKLPELRATLAASVRHTATGERI